MMNREEYIIRLKFEILMSDLDFRDPIVNWIAVDFNKNMWGFYYKPSTKHVKDEWRLSRRQQDSFYKKFSSNPLPQSSNVIRNFMGTFDDIYWKHSLVSIKELRS